jgi:putative effector of murein hydrolase
MEPIAKWLTIGILSALVITFIAMMVIKFVYSVTKNQEKQEKVSLLTKIFLKWSGLFFVFYALALGVLLLVLEIAKKFDTTYLEENWVSLQVVTHVLIPLLVTLALSLVSGIILFVIAKINPKRFKRTLLICGLVIGACLITSLILIGIHYQSNIKGDGYYTSDEAKLNPVA